MLVHVLGRCTREVLALQQVMPLLSEVSGSGRQLMIGKVTVLPGGDSGGSFAKGAIAAAEQIKAATGIDLAAAARRLEGTQPPPRPKG